jgi:hypothetical protein
VAAHRHSGKPSFRPSGARPDNASRMKNAAANAQIAWPSSLLSTVTLSGSVGYQGGARQLMTSPHFFWAVGPMALPPLF